MATGAGVPGGFGEVDAGDHPSSSGTSVFYAPDVRLGRRGVVDMVYLDQASGRLYYQTFSTVANRWGPRQVLGGGALANPGFYATPTRVFRNWASYGLVLDGHDRPHVVYCSGDRVLSRVLGRHGWSSPQLVASGHSPLHVQLATDAAGNIYAVWLDDPLGQPGSTAVMYAEQTTAGRWTQPQIVDRGSPNVLSDTTDDQGPSIVVTTSRVPYVLYLSGMIDSAGKADTTATIRYLRTGRWQDDTPPSSGYGITHSPQLYSRRNDIYLFLGHDAAIHFGYLIQRAGRPWSRYLVLDPASATDGSASVRLGPPTRNQRKHHRHHPPRRGLPTQRDISASALLRGRPAVTTQRHAIVERARQLGPTRLEPTIGLEEMLDPAVDEAAPVRRPMGLTTPMTQTQPGPTPGADTSARPTRPDSTNH